MHSSSPAGSARLWPGLGRAEQAIHAAGFPTPDRGGFLPVYLHRAAVAVKKQPRNHVPYPPDGGRYWGLLYILNWR